VPSGHTNCWSRSERDVEEVAFGSHHKRFVFGHALSLSLRGWLRHCGPVPVGGGGSLRVTPTTGIVARVRWRGAPSGPTTSTRSWTERGLHRFTQASARTRMASWHWRAVNLLFGFIGLFIAFLSEAGSAAARYGLWLCVRRLARQRSELLSRAVDYSLNGPCWCSLSRAAPRVSHVCAISH